MADKNEWKTPSMEGEEKGNGHQYGRKPRTPKPIPIAGELTHLLSPMSIASMGHWTPTGIEPMDYDDDDNYVNNGFICYSSYATRVFMTYWLPCMPVV